MPPTTVAEFREIINKEGFALVSDLLEEERSELFAEGYELFHFDTETDDGKPVKLIVATISGKTSREAETWLIDNVIDPKEKIEEIENLDPSLFETFHIDSTEIRIRPFYLIKKGMASWSETPEFFDGFLNRVIEIHQDNLDRNGVLFLNDLFPTLNLPRTRLGQLYGWKSGEIVEVENQKVITDTEYGKLPGFKLTFPNAHYIFDQIGD